MTIQKQIGEAIRSLRLELRMSQEELAEASGTHRTYVSQLERGTRNPTVTVLARLARALKVELPDLFRNIE